MDKLTIKRNDLLKALRGEKPARSAWGRGVQAAAVDLVEDAGDVDDLPTARTTLESILLNGARDWRQYSWGGCALCYNEDIALRYCTPSELKRTRNGGRRPNSREEWLDVQARALGQAARHILITVYRMSTGRAW